MCQLCPFNIEWHHNSHGTLRVNTRNTRQLQSYTVLLHSIYHFWTITQYFSTVLQRRMLKTTLSSILDSPFLQRGWCGSYCVQECHLETLQYLRSTKRMQSK